MNAHDTALAIALAIVSSGAPALVPVHVYAHDTEVFDDLHTDTHVAEITLPAIFVRVSFNALCGSATTGRAKIEIDVESQSDDETIETHSARETAVRQVMADQAGLVSAFETVGTVALLGIPSLGELDPGVEARAFKTPLCYKAGVMTISPSSGP